MRTCRSYRSLFNRSRRASWSSWPAGQVLVWVPGVEERLLPGPWSQCWLVAGWQPPGEVARGAVAPGLPAPGLLLPAGSQCSVAGEEAAMAGGPGGQGAGGGGQDCPIPAPAIPHPKASSFCAPSPGGGGGLQAVLPVWLQPAPPPGHLMQAAAALLRELTVAGLLPLPPPGSGRLLAP